MMMIVILPIIHSIREASLVIPIQYLIKILQLKPLNTRIILKLLQEKHPLVLSNLREARIKQCKTDRRLKNKESIHLQECLRTLLIQAWQQNSLNNQRNNTHNNFPLQTKKKRTTSRIRINIMKDCLISKGLYQ